jgi:hypothetical protein
MGWLIAGILVVILWRTRRRLNTLTKELGARPDAETAHRSRSSGHIYDLIVLRLELARLRAAGEIDSAYYEQITERIDASWSTLISRVWAVPQSVPWQERLEAAWAWLIRQPPLPPAPLPWHYEEEAPDLILSDETSSVVRAPHARAQTQETRADALAAATLKPPARLKAALSHSVVVPPLEADFSIQPTPQQPTPDPLRSAVPHASGQAKTLPAGFPSEPQATEDFALQPTRPGALEQALQALSGWPALLVPFLVQNIGWFIGGFCFVAGSIFLVSYTTGFAKALTILSVVFAYTVLVLWGGYQLRRRQPALAMSSNVLLTIGVLLVPLNITATVRLLLTGLPAPWLMAIALLAGAIGLGGLYVAVILVSGIMDRALQGRHPHMFVALAAMQLAVPLLTLWPSWLLLALLHSALLGLLAYGLVLFTRHWLHSIFVEQRKIAYYAAGTLVYAALVSFVHLTWGSGEPLALPHGYSSPFLIVLCGLVFYVDAQLKRWVEQDAFLSRLSFAIYGLSILALCLTSAAPAARILTLVLAIGLYALVTWQYATLPPLYLLLACSAWLYHQVVLQHVPYHWYFLASLPGLTGLFACSRWAWHRRSEALALIGYRVLVVSILGLACWSVLQAQPGLVPMGTALVVMGLAFSGLQYLPAPLFGGSMLSPDRSPSHRAISGALCHSAWLYTGTLASAVAVAYAPLWFGLTWETQCAGGLILLAQLWTGLALWRLRSPRAAETPRTEVLLNSAVLCLVAFLVLVTAVTSGLPDLTANRALPLLLALAGGVALQLSLGLGAQWLFYGSLMLWGTAGAIVKMTYFPALGSGVTAMSVALLVWSILWRIEQEPAEMAALRQGQAELYVKGVIPLTLLWWLPVSFRPSRDLIRLPLQQVMILLGVIGLAQIGLQLLAGNLGWAWAVAAGLGALLMGLCTGRWCLTGLLPLACALGLGAWLVIAFNLGLVTPTGLSVVGSVYALLMWQASVIWLAHPTTRRLAHALGLHGDRTRLEHTIHWTAFTFTVLCLVIPLGQYGLFVPRLSLLLSLATGMGFLWLAGQRYQRRVHSYVLLGSGILGTGLCYVWRFYADTTPLHSPWQELLNDPGLGMTQALGGLLFGAIAWGITSRRKRTMRMCSCFDRWDAPLRHTDAPADVAHRLYSKPLGVMAAALALLAAGQQLGLLWPTVISAGYRGGFLSIAALCLAGVSLLLANRVLGKPALSLAGMLGIVLAGLGAQSVSVHGSPSGAVWLGNATYTDQWLTLAVLALALACLNRSRQDWSTRLYTKPLHAVTCLTYVWALLGAVVLFVMLPVQTDTTLPWVFLVLTLGLIPLLPPFPAAASLRGIGTALLLTAAVVSALTAGGWQTSGRCVFVVWAYALWGLGNFGLPRFNARWPGWAIASETWPWLGLVLVWINLVLWGVHWQARPWLQASRLAWYLTAVAVYLFLMLRHSIWKGFPWLVVLTLTSAGMALNVAWLWPTSPVLALSLPVVGLHVPLLFVLGSVVWTNVLLLGASVWRRYGHHCTTHHGPMRPAHVLSLSDRLGWQPHDLATPLLFWASVCIHLGVLVLAVVDAGSILLPALGLEAAPWTAAVLLGGLLILSCLHLLWLQRDSWASHVVMASVFCTLLAVWLGIAAYPLHLPMFLALWSMILIVVDRVWKVQPWRDEGVSPLRHCLSAWLVWSALAAVAVWVLFPQVQLGERLLTLGILSGVAVYLGWQRHHSGWLFAAMTMLLLQLHGWWLFRVPPGQIARLFPWYALQLAGLTWCALWLRDRLRHAVDARRETDGPERPHTLRLRALLQALSWLLAPLAVLALLAWTLHALAVYHALAAVQAPQWFMGIGDVAVAVCALLLLIALGIRQAWFTQRAWWVYGVAILGGALGLYVRLLWIGLAPVQVWDTIALIAAAYALFILQRLTLSGPVLHLVLVLPLLALGTVPLQLSSPHASGALLSVGVLYLCTRRVTGRVLPLYMGMVALNLGTYVWVLGWAQHYQVFQLYILPAMVSLLWLLHFHRHDVRPSALHSVRLATLSVLYASATLDVFLRSGLLIFIAVVLLSLVGVMTGIALRTRAFLYAGVTFLVLNVAGQLILLFPEQRLGKAIVLLVLGAFITGGMIWFNVQREALLQRMRLFRADLATWA